MKRLTVLLTACFGLAACGGGGGSSPMPASQNGAPATAAPATTPATPPPSSGFAPTSVPVKVSSYTPTASIDPSDSHVLPLPVPSNVSMPPPAQVGKVHIFPVQPGMTTLGQRKRTSTFVNSPFDMQYEGGFVVGGTVQHNIYVSSNYRNCPSTCWGNPGQFVSDLGASSFIGHLDQYIGLTSPNRYTKGSSFAYTEFLASAHPGFRNPVVSQDDLLFLVYYASFSAGTGYGHVYHLFLHPGLDTCFDLSSSCYSPDNPRTFTFCAYHGSVDYGGGPLLYTVEPYQDVPGCGISGGPNTQNGDDLIDSTDSTLSHEIFETITDPDADAWYNARTGNEIGDWCVGILHSANLNGTVYALQSEYSNLDHACIN